MKYKYTIESGVTRIKTNTKKYMVGFVASLGIASALAVPAIAAKPAVPGCFGTDRAAVLHGMQDGTSPYSTGAPGASEWGTIAGQRAGDNGNQNQTYKTGCGGDPVQQ